MEAMKQLLIVLGLVSMLSVSAQDFASVPRAQMQSTSSMIASGSTLPFAAAAGVTTTYDNMAPVTITPQQKSGRPGDWKEPGLPLGDAVLPLLLLATAYAIYLRRKKRVQIPASEYKQ
jgi:hypothetical protein